MRTLIKWIGCLLALGASSLHAQPYTGGPGDGYDRVQASLTVSLSPPPGGQLWVWPQPVAVGGQWTLRGQSGRLQVEIWDLQGRRCWAGLVQAETAWPVPLLAAGWYQLRVSSPTHTWRLPLGVR